MSNEIKKIIATGIVSGSIIAGGFTASDRLNCDYSLPNEGQGICITEKQYQAVLSEIDDPSWNSIKTWGN